ETAVGWKTAKHLPRVFVEPHQTRGRAPRRPPYETVNTGAGDGVGWKTAKHLPRACIGPHQTRGHAPRRPPYETVSTGAGDGRRVEDCKASSTRLCRTTPN